MSLELLCKFRELVKLTVWLKTASLLLSPDDDWRRAEFISDCKIGCRILKINEIRMYFCSLILPVLLWHIFLSLILEREIVPWMKNIQVCKYASIQICKLIMSTCRLQKLFDIPLSTCILLLLGIGVSGESFIYSYIYIVQLRYRCRNIYMQDRLY